MSSNCSQQRRKTWQIPLFPLSGQGGYNQEPIPFLYLDTKNNSQILCKLLCFGYCQVRRGINNIYRVILLNKKKTIMAVYLVKDCGKLWNIPTNRWSFSRGMSDSNFNNKRYMIIAGGGCWQLMISAKSKTKALVLLAVTGFQRHAHIAFPVPEATSLQPSLFCKDGRRKLKVAIPCCLLARNCTVIL